MPNLPVGTRKTAYPRDVSLFLCFLKVSRQIFCLDTFGRQADEYITRGVMCFMFFYVFYVSMFAYEPGYLWKQEFVKSEKVKKLYLLY